MSTERGMKLACGGSAGDANEGFSAAVTEDGVLLMFGCGSRGQLGNGSTSHALVPVPADGIREVRYGCEPSNDTDRPLADARNTALLQCVTSIPQYQSLRKGLCTLIQSSGTDGTVRRSETELWLVGGSMLAPSLAMGDCIRGVCSHIS